MRDLLQTTTFSVIFGKNTNVFDTATLCLRMPALLSIGVLLSNISVILPKKNIYKEENSLTYFTY